MNPNSYGEAVTSSGQPNLIGHYRLRQRRSLHRFIFGLTAAEGFEAVHTLNRAET